MEVQETGLSFKTLKGVKEKIYLKNLKWALSGKKKIIDEFELGDIIYVKKENGFWKLKQYPKVNGGIVVFKPF